ncbi:SGNH/GDSL hydrolase family protein [Paenibacillus turpanensis]|uniref:SGNH/GDSL hydrolase family protein n=1 Tax=Paenibacillus turpanensis TaxID=2689078 RepID=UPI00140CA887|nr:SGNH/GDSL hydrolase family protein [Paenibacillus turpanensis]
MDIWKKAVEYAQQRSEHFWLKCTAAAALVLFAGLIYAGSAYQTREAEEQLASFQIKENWSFYEKIANSAQIEILVVGDNIGGGLGVNSSDQTWYSHVQAKLRTLYNASLDFDLNPTGAPTVLDGLVDYAMSQTKEKYDLVFVCFGYFDQEYTSMSEFSRHYEQLIRTLKEEKKNPEIYVIIEHNMYNDQYAEEIKKLSHYYDVPYVDTRGAESVAKAADSSEIYPDEEGQHLYSNAIIQVIEQQLRKGKTVVYEGKEPLQKLEENPRLETNFKMSTGFRKAGRLYMARNTKERLTLQTEGRPLGVIISRSLESGLLHVYVDGNKVMSIDCYGPERVQNYWFPHKFEDGPHTIVLEVSDQQRVEKGGGGADVLGIIVN